jgi:hypothetical protein
MMDALSSSETLVLTRVSRRNIAEDAILHNHINLFFFYILIYYLLKEILLQKYP